MQQQLPSMPIPQGPPSYHPPDNLQLSAPPQQSPLSETSPAQERAPLTPEQQRQQALNLEPYSRDDENGWIYK